MSNTKRPVYSPKYTNTAHTQGEPRYQPPESYISPINLDNDEERPISTLSTKNAATTSDLIPIKTSNGLACTIFLIIFGGIVLIAAAVAIVFSVVLNLTGTSSSSNSSVTTTSATVTATTSLYTCSNFNVTINWNYPNNDIVNVSPMSFGLCCLWCLSVSTCTTFVLTNSTGACWLKTSPGSGGAALVGTIAATL